MMLQENRAQSYENARDPIGYAFDITEEAAKQIHTFREEEENLNVYLRIAIQGGGCSGFRYVMDFVAPEDKKIQDIVIEKSITDIAIPVRVLIDSISFMYLQGGSLDYKEDIQGARFVIANPNSKSTCGCGSSFSI